MSALEQKNTELLFTKVYGKGAEIIVFIPGLGGTTRYWESRIGPLADEYRVVLIDLLGFGESAKPWTRYSVERHVGALHSALGALGPISIVGHSLGALLTVAYAARYPDDIKNIITMGMPCFGSQRNAYQYMRHGPVRGGYIYTNMALTMLACIITRRLLGRLLPYLIRNVPREVAEDLVKHTWCASTSSLWEVVYRYDVAEDIGRLPQGIGVVCIHGDQDEMAPLAAVKSVASSHSDWRIFVLPGVDHHPFLRNPEFCLEIITSQLRLTN
jgi:pimeloyl-ACP methyl ester carboxylesterase